MPITLDGAGSIGGVSGLGGGNFQATSLETTSGGLLVHEVSSSRYTLRVDATNNTVGINTSSAPAAGVFLQVADGTDPIVSLNYTGGTQEVRLGCTAAGGYIGTESNHPFNIEANSATAVTVLANGNVGIGVTSPADKLEVLGDVRLIPPSGPNTLINFEYNNGTFAQIRGNGRNSNPLYGDIEFWTKDGNDGAPVERLVVRAEGRVGINTATPSRTFDVESNVGEVTTFFKRNVTGSSDEAQGVSVFSVSDATRTTGEGFGPSINFEHRDNVTAYAGGQISSEREADGNRSDLVFYSRRYGYQETFRATADQALQLSTNCLGIDFSLITGSSTGSVTSNTLDDYEEGTWTPVFTASNGGQLSTALNVGIYVKIGSNVYISFRIATTQDDFSGFSGQVRIDGLPFTVGTNVQARVGGLSIIELYRWTTNFSNFRAYPEASNTTINLNVMDSNSLNYVNCEVSDMETGVNKNIMAATGWYSTETF